MRALAHGFRRSLWPTVATLATLLVLLGLGTWQLQRLEWKQRLIAAREGALAEAPIPVPEDPTAVAALNFRRVEARGEFLHEKSVRLQGRSYGGRPGAHLLTPLRLSDGAVLLVNRGWVPASGARQASPIEKPAGAVTVRGILRSRFPHGYFTPENRPRADAWYWVELPALSRHLQLPLLPAVLEAGAGDPGQLPIGGQTRTELRNNHLQYAVTWYGLAVALLLVYGAYLRTVGKEALAQRGGSGCG